MTTETKTAPHPSGRIERPEIEEFIRLCSNPKSPWGMADIDALEICNYVLHLEARLRSHCHEVGEAAWRPIDTAPKDGTIILVYGPHFMPSHIATTWWVLNLPTGKKGGHMDAPMVADYWTNGRGHRLDFEPTHWQPLPAPPASPSQGEEEKTK